MSSTTKRAPLPASFPDSGRQVATNFLKVSCEGLTSHDKAGAVYHTWISESSCFRTFVSA
jgi:hypothetical protein